MKLGAWFSPAPPAMLTETAAQSKPRKIWMELLIFALVFFLISSIQSIPAGLVTVWEIFSDGEFQALLEAGTDLTDPADLEAYMERWTAFITDLTENPPASVLLVSNFACIVTIFGALLYCTLIAGRTAGSMGFRRKGALRESLAGLVGGFLLFALAVGLCLVTGTLSLSPAEPINWSMILLFFLGFLIQGTSEEVLLRGYLFPALCNGHSTYAAMGVSSLLFALLHIANPGITPLAILNLFLFGVFACLYVLRRGSIWGIAGLHAAWNFVQGNVFGIQVSGMKATYSVFRADTAEIGEILNGGAFGLEGGLAVTFVLGLGILLLGMPRQHDLNWHAKNDPTDPQQPTQN